MKYCHLPCVRAPHPLSTPHLDRYSSKAPPAARAFGASQGLVASAIPTSQATRTPASGKLAKDAQSCSWRASGEESEESEAQQQKEALFCMFPLWMARTKNVILCLFHMLCNKNQTTSQKELFLSYHCHSNSHPSQPPVTQQWAVSSCHAEASLTVCRSMENATRYIKVGVEHDNKRLHTSVRMQTTPVQQRGNVGSSSCKHSSSKSRNTQSLRQRSHGDCASWGTRDRFLQPLFFSSKKGRWPSPCPRSALFESRSSKTLIQNDYTETNPIAHSAPGLVYFSGHKGCLFPYPVSPSSQTFSEICFRTSVLSIFGTPLRPLLCSTHFYKVHERSPLPSSIDGNTSSELPRWLVNYGSLSEQALQPQEFSHQPPPVSGAQNQCEKSQLQHMQNIPFLGVSLDFISIRAHLLPELSRAIMNSLAVFKESRPLKWFQRAMGLMAAASAVCRLGLL